MFKGFLDIFGSDLLSLFDGLFLKGLTMGYRWGHVWVIIDQLDMGFIPHGRNGDVTGLCIYIIIYIWCLPWTEETNVGY